MSSPPRTRNVHYILSTHWDREWYEPFQHYRFRLVNLLDGVLDGLEEGRLRGPFTTDGQAIILADYLEIRPERREQVERFAREGKLRIGPWYVLPDEFIVSGEAHLRNIRLGMETARGYGAEPSRAGFACDLFGHLSQLPQIFSGFGIRSIFIWRGVNLGHQRNFIWVGADGTELVGYRFSFWGYSEYAAAVGRAFDREGTFDAGACGRHIDEFLATQSAATAAPPILFFDGADHLEWNEPVYNVLAQRFGAAEGGFRFLHGGLDEFAGEMIAGRDMITERFEGELREPGRDRGKVTHLIPGVLSSRVWIKQRNADCQNMLCHWMEPMGAFANHLTGIEYPDGYLAFAWKTLLENHPHDSICGCSVDLVHEDMKYRFSQVEQAAGRVTLDRLRKIAASVEGEVGGDALRLAIFNPLPRPIMEEVVEVDLEIPADWPFFQEFFGFEKLPAFRIHAHDGAEIPYQRIGQTVDQTRVRIRPHKFPDPRPVNLVRVSLPVSIPAMGYTTLLVRKGEETVPTRHPMGTPMAMGNRALENEHLRVEVDSNGSLRLIDKAGGSVYTGLNSFEDNADIGDGWFHGAAINDQVFDSHASPADVALVENGPMAGALRVCTRMRVPEEFDFRRMVRSERLVELEIESTVRLRRGARHAEIETRVNNIARDHRLRALFPSGAESSVYHADSAFDMIERPVALRADNHEYMELEVETTPQQTWTAIHDGERGLAIVSTGLMESCVRDTEERPLALTLLRCTGRTVMTAGEPEGQIPGVHAFRYWVTPLRGKLDADRLFHLGQRLGAGLRALTLHEQDIRIDRTTSALPLAAGFIAVEGPAVMTSCRRVGAGLEIRLFNPHDEAISAAITGSEGFNPADVHTRAYPVDFESNRAGEDLKLTAGGVEFEMDRKKILTIRLE